MARTGGGLLSGRQGRSEGGRHSKGGPVRPEGKRERGILGSMRAVEDELDATPAQVALAWVQHTAMVKPGPVRILGARTRAQLDDSLGVLGLRLDDARVARLTQPAPQYPGFPHEFLGTEHLRAMVTGGAWHELAGTAGLWRDHNEPHRGHRSTLNRNSNFAVRSG